MPNVIVFADGDSLRRRDAVERLPREWEVYQCADRASLFQLVNEKSPVVVVIGSLTDGIHAVEAAHFVHEAHPAAKVIVVADTSSEAFVMAALRSGVFDYMKAPVGVNEIAESVSRAMPLAPQTLIGFESLIGASKPIQAVKELVQRVAPLNSTVLVTGESGTGKEIIARLIHNHSTRSQRPFISLNCAAIPDTLVESELFGHERGAFTGAITRQVGQIKNADQGTLFLDEIGDMSPLAQSKMLRVLEQHEIQPLGCPRTIPVDIRLIAATHCDLESLIHDHTFRTDLYYRLDVVRIHMTPLRDRPEDVPLLSSHFLREVNHTYGRQLGGFTPGAMDLLMENRWPGNVRQLRNVIEAAGAVCESDRISVQDLRALHTFRESAAPDVKKTSAPCIATKIVKPDKGALLQALEATRWNMTRTAELLNWSRSTLYRTIARYNIERSTAHETSET